MIQLILVGKTKDSALKQLCEEFEKRLSRFVKLDITYVAEEKSATDAPIIKKKEGERILAAQKGTLLVCLDAAGIAYTSESFADFVKKHEMESVTFVIGGAYGLSDEVKHAAQHTLSLSHMTFTHDMARMLFLEQLYRACTIHKNIPYHK